MFDSAFIGFGFKIGVSGFLSEYLGEHSVFPLWVGGRYHGCYSLDLDRNPIGFNIGQAFEALSQSEQKLTTHGAWRMRYVYTCVVFSFFLTHLHAFSQCSIGFHSKPCLLMFLPFLGHAAWDTVV